MIYSIMGLHTYSTTGMQGEVRQKAIRYILAGTYLVTVLLVITSINAFQVTNDQYIAQNIVEKWIGPASFEISSVTLKENVVTVTLL